MADHTHPITPPLELVRQWRDKWRHDDDEGTDFSMFLATQAARWGDEQRLEACIDVILAHPGLEHPELLVEVLRAAFRPKPPSLAEEALTKINAILGDPRKSTLKDEIEALELSRRALERLKELENGNE